jgi:hypothetical protein
MDGQTVNKDDHDRLLKLRDRGLLSAVDSPYSGRIFKIHWNIEISRGSLIAVQAELAVCLENRQKQFGRAYNDMAFEAPSMETKHE